MTPEQRAEKIGQRVVVAFTDEQLLPMVELKALIATAICEAEREATRN